MFSYLGEIGFAVTAVSVLIYIVRTGTFWVPPPGGFQSPRVYEAVSLLIGMALLIASVIVGV